MTFRGPESGVEIYKRMAKATAGATLAAVTLAACGENQLHSDNVVIEGSVPKPDCDKVPWTLPNGTYDDLKQMKDASRDIQKEVCKGMSRIARKALKLYQSGEAENVTVYSERNENAKKITIHTIVDPDSIYERGGTVSFKMREDGTPNLKKVESVITWARAPDTLQTVQITTEPIEDGTRYNVQNRAALTTLPTGYCMVPVDTTDRNSLNQQQPTLESLEGQQDDVAVVMASMMDMVMLETEKAGC